MSETVKERENPKIQLDLKKGQSLKPLPKDVITKFLEVSVEKISKQTGFEFSKVKTGGVNIITIFTPNKKISESISEEFNRLIAYEFTKFIESETGIDASKFHRTRALFESTVEDNRISIQW